VSEGPAPVLAPPPAAPTRGPVRLRGAVPQGVSAGVYQRLGGRQSAEASLVGEQQRKVAGRLLVSCLPSGACGLLGSMGLPLFTGSFWARNVYIDGKSRLYCPVLHIIVLY